MGLSMVQRHVSLVQKLGYPLDMHPHGMSHSGLRLMGHSRLESPLILEEYSLGLMAQLLVLSLVVVWSLERNLQDQFVKRRSESAKIANTTSLSSLK